MARTSGSIVGKDLAASATTGIFTVQQALTKKAAGDWPASSGWGQYEIERSLRFNSADSAYLDRTPASAGNRKTWTWSGWVKRSALSIGTYQGLFSALEPSGITFSYLIFDTATSAIWVGQGATTYRKTSAVYRDISGWYHIVYSVDTTQATASNRIKLYVNGVEVTAFSASADPTLNQDLFVSAASLHSVGCGLPSGSPGEYFNGYMTEINFIDGSALDPTSFGEFNTDTGVWQPKAYTGSYGTNGFYLNFSDNSGVTSTTLGKDQAGSNNWTPNNFSVTAGAGNDSLVDTPTRFGTDTGAGGEVRGNYCTANPLDMNPTLVISNGNLNVTETTGAWLNGRCTFGMSSGKWYAESTVTGGLYQVFGIANSLAINTGYEGGGLVGNWAYGNDGSKIVNGVYTTPYGATFTTNDVIGMAFDADAGTLTMYKNGVSQGVLVSGLPANTYFPWVAVNGSGGNTTVSFNFGQRPFAYTAPSGFKALCTTNLPDPTVVQGDEYFNTVLWTGDGSTPRAISGVGFQPDWVWYKRRSLAFDHNLFDVIRGAGQLLESSSTSAESTQSERLISFNADGFTVGNNAGVNASSNTYVAWNWNAGGSNATNTDGTITATVRANPTAGFSIVTYTGTGSAATVGHGLGAAPGMIIVKNRDAADAWQVYHKNNTAAPETDYLVLNTTAATADAADRWNDTAPTSTVFSIGNGVEVNTNTEDYVAYCFAEVPGYSAFGSYTGNGSADGPFVFTGHRPAFVMIKGSSDSDRAWVMLDVARNTYNVMNLNLYANASDAEATDTRADGLSNGFKLRGTGTWVNNSGSTYIYMSLASNPFKYALGR